MDLKAKQRRVSLWRGLFFTGLFLTGTFSRLDSATASWNPPEEFSNSICADINNIKLSPTAFVRQVRKSVKHGDAWAQRCLGWLAENGNSEYGVLKDRALSSRLLQEAFATGKKLADSGDPVGMWFYGDSLCRNEFHDHLTIDKAACQRLLKRSAEKGSVRAADDYANFFEEDPFERVQWWRIAAEGGNSNAQYRLGMCLLEGSAYCKLNLKDLKRPGQDEGALNAQRWIEGVHWLRKAAEHGDRRAMVRLANAYRRNLPIEIPQDLVEAYKWYFVLSEKDSSPLVQKDSRIRMEDIAYHRMNAAQVLEGRKRAREFIRFLFANEKMTADDSPVILQWRDTNLVPFLDPLPIPPSLRAQGPKSELVIRLQQFKWKFHRDLPPTLVWGYENTIPGPTIEAEKNEVLRVHWENHLPLHHVLPMVSQADDMAEMKMSGPLPEVRAVTHLHGAEVSEPDPMNRRNNNDGWPDAWNVPGESQLSQYPNAQEARTLWYHDHAMAITGRNVYAGLAGFYLIHDPYEKSLNLPAGKFDVPLMIQGRSFAKDGSLIYPQGMPYEVYGDTLTVNGKIWPYFTVEPRKYRFRILNASNARRLELRMVSQKDENQKSADSSLPSFLQIGSDGGFLEKAVSLQSLPLVSSERVDVIVDFSKNAGQEIRLENIAPPEEPDLGPPIRDVMLFRVSGSTSSAPNISGPDTSVAPTNMRAIPRLNPRDAIRTRQMVLTQTSLPRGGQLLLLNGQRWTDPLSDKLELGTTEIWEIINGTSNIHPFHVHSLQFQVLDRAPIKVSAYLEGKKLQLTGDRQPPSPSEMGWKDTVAAPPGEVTRIIMKIAPFAGFYVYHCHILEHEDMDMMRPLEIVDPAKHQQ